MGRKWEKSDFDRYQKHKLKEYELPKINGKLPPLLTWAIQRWDTFIRKRTGFLSWSVKEISAPEGHRGATLVRTRLAVQRFHHHDHLTKSGNPRLRRDQAIHSAHLILRYLLGRVNVQLNNRLEWLEVARTSIERVSQATGLSRSATRDGLALLGDIGFLRSQREKEFKEDGIRERPARRWLTPHLFAALGLSKLFLRQLRGGRKAQKAPAPTYSAAHKEFASVIPFNKGNADPRIKALRAAIKDPP